MKQKHDLKLTQSFIETNKVEIIKQLNKKEKKEKISKTIDFNITYINKDKIYAERDYLSIGEKNKKMTSLDEISFSIQTGRYKIEVFGETLKYSLYNI
jgi:hypothetical protein